MGYINSGYALLERGNKQEAMASFGYAEKLLPSLQANSITTARSNTTRASLPTNSTLSRGTTNKTNSTNNPTSRASPSGRATVEALHLLAKGLLNSGDDTGAVRVYEKILTASPKDIKAINGLGISYNSMGAYEVAQNLYRNGLGIHPASLTLKNNLALSLMFDGKPNQAIAILKRSALGDTAEAMKARENLALAYVRSGNLAAAQKVIKMGHPATDARSRLAILGNVAKQLPSPVATSRISPASQISPRQRLAANSVASRTTTALSANPTDTYSTATRPTATLSPAPKGLNATPKGLNAARGALKAKTRPSARPKIAALSEKLSTRSYIRSPQDPSQDLATHVDTSRGGLVALAQNHYGGATDLNHPDSAILHKLFNGASEPKQPPRKMPPPGQMPPPPAVAESPIAKPAIPPPVAQMPMVRGTFYSVQLGFFKTKTRAERMLQSLTQKSNMGELRVEPKLVRGTNGWAVYHGLYAQESEARRAISLAPIKSAFLVRITR